MTRTISHACPPDEYWDEEEHETYACELCGRQEEVPAIVIFSGDGDRMTATAVCFQCAEQVRAGL